MKGDVFMDTNKKDSDNSPASNSASPTTGFVPSTQPLPKKEDKIRSNAVQNVGSTKDSDPTL